MKGPGLLPRILFTGHFLLIILLVFCCSACTERTPSFSAVLALIDQQKAGADPELFQTAFILADTTEDKLRVLKRAQAHDAGLVLMLATENYLVVQSELVALVFFDAFMNSRDWMRAYALWQKTFNYPEYSSLLLELAIELGRENPFELLKFDTAQLSLAAGKAKLPELLVLRALLALYEADASLAAVLLSEAAASPLLLPAQVLWDAGLDAQLLEQQGRYLDWASRKLLINAAYTLKQPEVALALAASYLEQADSPDQAIALQMTVAFFYYLQAARSGFYDIPVAVMERYWPFENQAAHFAAQIQIMHQNAERLYSNLYYMHPDNPEIIQQFALWLLASRQFDRFPMLISELNLPSAESALLLLLFKYYKEGPDYARVQAVQDAAKFQNRDTLAAIGRFFLSIDAYDDFVLMQFRYGNELGQDSLFAAYRAVYEGAYIKAQQLFSGLFLPDQPELAPYNLGILSLKTGNFSAATDYFRTAALTSEQQARLTHAAAAWTWAARSVFMLGNKAEAARYLQNALSADPDSGQARLFLLQLSGE